MPSIKPTGQASVLYSNEYNLQASLTNSTDNDIITMLRLPESQEQGLRLLMHAYQERLYHHLRRMVGSHEATDDLLQDTFVKAYRNIGQFEGKAQLYTWLYRIATNEALTYLKQRSRQDKAIKAAEEAALKAPLSIAYSAVDGDRLQQSLARALAGLPYKQRLVFSLRYYEEMSYKEMSALLETSEGALKASYHHAVKKIEAAISNE